MARPSKKEALKKKVTTITVTGGVHSKVKVQAVKESSSASAIYEKAVLTYLQNA